MNLESEFDDAILDAILHFAATLVDIDGNAGLLVDEPNTDLGAADIASRKEYLRVSIIPGQPEHTHVCGTEARYLWLVQVDAFIDKGLGATRARAHLDALRAAFPRLHVFVSAGHTFEVTRTLAINGLQHDGTRVFVPSTLQIETHA